MNQLITTHPVKLQTSGFCTACGCGLQPNDNFCGHCGAGCRDLIVPATTASQSDYQPTAIAITGPAGSLQEVVNNRMLVIGAIVCTGPLGLLALWFSQSFSNQTKIITTLAYILLTLVVPAAVICYYLSRAFQPVVEALG